MKTIKVSLPEKLGMEVEIDILSQAQEALKTMFGKKGGGDGRVDWNAFGRREPNHRLAWEVGRDPVAEATGVILKIIQ
ncbi:MAG: hypothetical protein ACUVXI_05915 [bacterium]